MLAEGGEAFSPSELAAPQVLVLANLVGLHRFDFSGGPIENPYLRQSPFLRRSFDLVMILRGRQS